MIQSNYTSKIKFWKSRYLRLYPTYIFCILATFLLQQKFSFLRQLYNLPFPAVFFNFYKPNHVVSRCNNVYWN
nr:hypothetical protein [Candidatus Rickettsia colombianensi]